MTKSGLHWVSLAINCAHTSDVITKETCCIAIRVLHLSLTCAMAHCPGTIFCGTELVFEVMEPVRVPI